MDYFFVPVTRAWKISPSFLPLLSITSLQDMFCTVFHFSGRKIYNGPSYRGGFIQNLKLPFYEKARRLSYRKSMQISSAYRVPPHKAGMFDKKRTKKYVGEGQESVTLTASTIQACLPPKERIYLFVPDDVCTSANFLRFE
ncbi:hypothetical protein AVEN_164632-1 [Araneus ventricosus]|uniref:Uncharacterized protein n=1 Tax=Araneus ventricosus TaxID=182803 RepID=A0A4Y2ME26_ARAVE|nr:hypothetical protein AVEN_164632-1 [Araneus ventricosus]